MIPFSGIMIGMLKGKFGIWIKRFQYDKATQFIYFMDPPIFKVAKRVKMIEVPTCFCFLLLSPFILGEKSNCEVPI